jgi:hypothetical protein
MHSLVSMVMVTTTACMNGNDQLGLYNEVIGTMYPNVHDWVSTSASILIARWDCAVSPLTRLKIPTSVPKVDLLAKA